MRSFSKTMRTFPPLAFGLALFSLAIPALAHIGSPDVFFEGHAGPYSLLVTIRPPQVIPGVAEIEIRTLTAGVTAIHIVPLRLIAPQQFAPVPDLAHASLADPRFYTGSLWLMATGSWKVRVDVEGASGPGTLSVPVPALSTRILTMQKTIGAALIPLGLVLVFGLIAIVGASVREGPLAPGAPPDPRRLRSSRIAMATTALILCGVLYLGNQWWESAAGDSANSVFKPLGVQAAIEQGNQLTLRLTDPGWLNRRTDDLLPDHNHLMHLYVIHLPAMDRVWHLHPELDAGGTFRQFLPDMPAGRYALYGDIVHANGIGETVTAQLDLPEIHGRELSGDDAASDPPDSIPPESDPPSLKANSNPEAVALAGGYRMVWDRGAAPIHARRPYQFRFHLQDRAGQPASDMDLYMGMLGHAAFVATDGSVFAHVHPSGSVPMAALTIGQVANPHAEHMLNPEGLPSAVSFPYGFPKPGSYRIFVQMKRAGRVVTGIFTTTVEN
jgi:hypothetical protein